MEQQTSFEAPIVIMSGVIDFYCDVTSDYARGIGYIVYVSKDGVLYDISLKQKIVLAQNIKKLIPVTLVSHWSNKSELLPDNIYHPGCLALSIDNELLWFYRVRAEDFVGAQITKISAYAKDASLDLAHGVICYIDETDKINVYDINSFETKHYDISAKIVLPALDSGSYWVIGLDDRLYSVSMGKNDKFKIEPHLANLKLMSAKIHFLANDLYLLDTSRLLYRIGSFDIDKRSLFKIASNVLFYAPVPDSVYIQKC